LSGSIGSLAQLEKLPVIGRKNVVEACERMACSPLTGDLTWRQTSGTSGLPLRIPWSREQLDAVIAVRMRFSRQMGLKPWS
jgi:phenylacetate-coenzyme A ligase PaaK-like adenylate-forming protein